MMETNYDELGYIHFENFFTESELDELQIILNKFHENWLIANDEGYKTGLINSHSLTSSEFINEQERLSIFKFISQDKIASIVKSIFPAKALFLNTQLFFDPFNGKQNNYWHRDGQYTGMSTEELKESILKQNVIHFRIALKSELGIELIPSTHKNWDLEEELETRLSLNGRKQSDGLERGKVIGLNRGDLLVFSANMVHRGLYGNDRFSFDVIFCDDSPEFKAFIDNRNLPTKQELGVLDSELF